MMAVTLTVSIVTFASELEILTTTLDSLDRALHQAKQVGILQECRLEVVDNGPVAATRSIAALITSRQWLGIDTLVHRSGHGNVGFGAGHNLVQSGDDFRLILNPDVIVDEQAIIQGLIFLIDHPEAGLLAPDVRDRHGERQYLCKNYPDMVALLLRGFAPPWLRYLCRRHLHRYELRDQIGGQVVWDIPIVSGCFMLLRNDIYRRLNGFDPRFFLYFEDFDLSIRLRILARTVYVPTVHIHHFGGHAARKGWWHVMLFTNSARRFFSCHGWRWW